MIEHSKHWTIWRQCTNLCSFIALTVFINRTETITIDYYRFPICSKSIKCSIFNEHLVLIILCFYSNMRQNWIKKKLGINPLRKEKKNCVQCALCMIERSKITQNCMHLKKLAPYLLSIVVHQGVVVVFYKPNNHNIYNN